MGVVFPPSFCCSMSSERPPLTQMHSCRVELSEVGGWDRSETETPGWEIGFGFASCVRAMRCCVGGREG